MSKPPSSMRVPAYASCQRKTFHSALCHLLRTEFPGTFGPAVTRLFADRIDELYGHCHPPLSRVKVGQVLWLAVAANERAGRSKRIEDTRLVPVLLDLVTREDIDDACAGGKHRATRRAKITRLFRQAYAQGAVLTEADVGLLLHLGEGAVSAQVRAHEKATSESIPRRGTLHDLGRSVSHKAVICYKRLVEKKPTSQVAEETYHSPEEVEYYVQTLRRVQLCIDNGMSVDEAAHATGHSLFLVIEYAKLINELGLPSMPDSSKKENV